MTAQAKVRERVAAIALLALALDPGARAGVVIEVDPAIGLGGVSVLRAEGQHLVVVDETGMHVVRLPYGALPYVADLAAQGVEGPLVFSIDGAFVSGSGQYYPEAVMPELGSTILSYDVYAHELALGCVPSDLEAHPLFASEGSEDSFPHRRSAALLDASNTSTDAIWYRRLAAGHIAEGYYTPAAGVVGEITLRGLPNDGEGLPVRIEVSSFRTFLPVAWYRNVAVASDWDHWAFGLPFRELRAHIEHEWDLYREMFSPMDELSSIVEAYALLNAAYLLAEDDDRLWCGFRDSLIGEGEGVAFEAIHPSSGPWLSFPFDLSSQQVRWNGISRRTVGETVDTSAEANMALALLRTGYGPADAKTEDTWRAGIASFAKPGSSILAKQALDLAVRGGGELGLAEAARQFFDAARELPEGVRLRASGLDLLYREYGGFYGAFGEQNDGADEDFLDVLRGEREQILEDFVAKVEEAVAQDRDGKPTVFRWESLSQDVYSCGLLELAATDWPEVSYYNPSYIDEAVALAVAEVHRHRALAHQIGRELGSIHAHYRFLGYLPGRCPDSARLVEVVVEGLEAIEATGTFATRRAQ